MAAKLRPGNVSSADDWGELLVPEIDRQQAEGQRVAFRADAAFARPAIYEALEARGVGYAIRIPANKKLELAIEDVLFRSPGRPSRTPLVRYKSVQYQADSWTTPRRIVAKVEHHVGELFPRVGFIVTNLPLPNHAVVRFYNKRVTAEQWIKEGSRRRIGRACRVTGSERTRSGYSCACSRTTSGISGGGWCSRSGSTRVLAHGGPPPLARKCLLLSGPQWSKRV